MSDDIPATPTPSPGPDPAPVAPAPMPFDAVPAAPTLVDPALPHANTELMGIVERGGLPPHNTELMGRAFKGATPPDVKVSNTEKS